MTGLGELTSRFLLQGNNKQGNNKQENDKKLEWDDFWLNHYRLKSDEDRNMHNSKDFSDDFKACIDTQVLTKDGLRYEVISGNYTYNAYECAKYKYNLRTRACACGNPDGGIEGSVHGIFGCRG